MSENTVTLSVIIPVYNAEHTIRETLDSVLNQSLKEIEVICVDDGSRDASVEVIREYMARDSRIQLLRQQNRYAGAARNAGIDVAKGEYLFFLDADDYVLDYALEAACAKAEKYNLDCLKFMALTWDEKEGRYVDKPRNSGGLLGIEDYNRLLKVGRDSALLRVGVTPWSGIYRRAFVLEKNCRFNHLRCVNDRSFWTKVMTNADRMMIVRDRVTVHRISQDQSLVGKRSEHFDCQIESAQLTEHQLREDGVSPEAMGQIMQQEYVDLAVWYSRFSVNPEQKTEMDRQIREYLDNSGTAYGDLLTRWLSRARSSSQQSPEVKPFHDAVPDPFVSVLVPVGNTEEILNRALDSLTGQNLEEMEFLLLDSGRTELGRAIMKEYAAIDRRFRILDVSGAEGYEQMMNLGLAQAKGEYIGLLEPQDYVSADMYERLWKQAKKHNLDLIQSNYTRFRIAADGKLETQSVVISDDGDLYGRTLKQIKGNRVFSMPPQAGNGLYRRAFLQENGVRWDEKSGCETEGNGFPGRAQAAVCRVRLLRGQLYWEEAGENEAFIPDAEQNPKKGFLPKLWQKTRAGKDLLLEYGMGYTMDYARNKLRIIREVRQQRRKSR